MELICLGDLAISDAATSRERWVFPVEGFPAEERRLLINWEFPVGDRLNTAARSSGKRFLAQPGSPQVIGGWAPGFVSLATNHMLDAGPEGVGATITALERGGFTTFGAGRSQEEIRRPLVWETSQGRLVVVNWVFSETHPDWNTVPGVNCWPGEKQAAETVRDLRGEADWLMALLHWSDELFAYPRPVDRQVGSALASIGFDLVVAHHPHVVRGMEWFGHTPVYYSLGNFFFSDLPDLRTGALEPHAPRNREGLGLRITLRRGERPALEPLSFWQEGRGIQLDPRRRAQRRLEQASRPLKDYSGRAYDAWYQKERSWFDRWGARWHFVVRRLGLRGMLRYAASRIKGRQLEAV